MKALTYIMAIMIMVVASCKEDSFTFGDLTPPAQPEADLTVIGKDDANPDGDGSGKIELLIKSEGAINYKVDFGDGSTPLNSSNNRFAYSYKHTGVADYTITIAAFGRGGISSMTTMPISLLRNFQPKAELVTMLTADDSKVWVIDSLAAGHLGVGPADEDSPSWWSAPPKDKAGMGIYDDEYIFTVDGKFTHITHNSLFGKKENLRDFDASLVGEDDFTLTGSKAADYNDEFMYDGSDTEEFIVFKNLGHLGNYVGSHRFQILERSETSMLLKTIGKDTNAWFVKIKAKE